MFRGEWKSGQVPALVGHGTIEINLRDHDPTKLDMYRTELTFSYDGLFNAETIIKLPCIVQPMIVKSKTYAKCLKYDMPLTEFLGQQYHGEGSLMFQITQWNDNTITGTYQMKSIDPKKEEFPNDSGVFQLSKVRKVHKRAADPDLGKPQEDSKCAIL